MQVLEFFLFRYSVKISTFLSQFKCTQRDAKDSRQLLQSVTSIFETQFGLHRKITVDEFLSAPTSGK